ncbi:MAG: RNA polymerase sigma factor [Ruminococcaceae bacterium]|nr:RNA polymerase sigma factor [Oscillospiraceae bacterium]
MQDDEIITLYLERNEDAIRQTEKKYGKALKTMAMRILSDEDDSQECVNDTYLKTWNSIPPMQPSHLSAYLHKLVRRISIDRYRGRHSEKRKPNEYTASLDELGECLAGEETPQGVLELQLLTQTIEAFLQTLSEQNRQIFLCRYYFLDPVKQIAKFFSISESNVKSTLYRIRSGLKEHLKQEGFFL